MREEILSTTTEDIRRFAHALTQVAAHGRVVVLGSEQAIQAANAEWQGFLRVSKVI
jgi:presequence protease